MHQRLLPNRLRRPAKPVRILFHGATVALCLWSCLASAGRELTSKPKIGLVATGSAVLRAGPGKHFYATNRIPRNTRLECYQKATENWVAVRPVESSFSLVAKKDMVVTDDHRIGQISSANAKCWIGSRLMGTFNLHSVVQLDQGERLLIRGVRTVTLHHGAPSQTMYEIAPPNGEFRWVHKSNLRSGHFGRLPRAQQSKPGTGLGDSFVARSTYHRPVTNPNAELLSPVATSQTAGRNNGPAAINGLVLQLTSTIAQPMEQWTFDTLHHETAELAKYGKNIVIRARAHKLLARIDRLSSLKKEALSNPLRIQYKRSNQSSINDYQQGPVGTGVRQPVASRTAGEQNGWLLPTVSKVDAQKRIPPYVLKNDLGKITAFVTPSPGLNLHRYSKQRVRIRGKREFLKHSQVPHVTATRVIQSTRRQY